MEPSPTPTASRLLPTITRRGEAATHIPSTGKHPRSDDQHRRILPGPLHVRSRHEYPTSHAATPLTLCSHGCALSRFQVALPGQQRQCAEKLVPECSQNTSTLSRVPRVPEAAHVRCADADNPCYVRVRLRQGCTKTDPHSSNSPVSLQRAPPVALSLAVFCLRKVRGHFLAAAQVRFAWRRRA